jgi:hypothetical protein
MVSKEVPVLQVSYMMCQGCFHCSVLSNVVLKKKNQFLKICHLIRA